jgi:methylenetetrahydrofolate dehydrogenase (NADP+)/methenyltetrahydrofolate cyclohydrolase
LATNQEDRALVPATALAVVHIIERSTGLHGKHIVVLGRGRTVGRPVAQMALNRHATVTICHSQTKHLEKHTKTADILVAAIGRAGFINGAHVREGQVIIDCGNTVHGTSVVGDVDEQSVIAIVQYLTPVPGGVGLLTNSFLFSNLLKAAAFQAV